MVKHLHQAQHNENFLKEVMENHPTDFWDWKNTIIFYTIIHYLRAYAEIKGIEIDGSHSAMRLAILGDSQKAIAPTLNVPEKVSRGYTVIKNACHSARYAGFTTKVNFDRYNQINFNEALTHKNNIKSWILSQLPKKEKEMFESKSVPT